MKLRVGFFLGNFLFVFGGGMEVKVILLLLRLLKFVGEKIVWLRGNGVCFFFCRKVKVFEFKVCM